MGNSRFVRLITFVIAMVLVLAVLPSSTGAQQNQVAATGGVVGNTYTSPTYGYSVTWDSSWRVTDAQSADGEDILALGRGDTTTVYFDAYPTSETEDQCVQSSVNDLWNLDSVSNVVQATSNNGPLEGRGEIGTWTVYDVTVAVSATSNVDMTIFILCRSIVPGQAMLGVAQIVPSDQYNDELDPLITLLNSITLPGAVVQQPTPTAEVTVGNENEMVAFLRQATNDIDTYWARIYPTISEGQPYVPPTDYVPYDGPISTPCGDATAGAMRMGDGPFYCPRDAKVYLDILFANDQYSNFGLFPVAEAVAHEVAHHVQMSLGIRICEQSPCLDPTQVTSQELEVMADCFAGAWSKDAEVRGRLGSFDIEVNIAQYAVIFGDHVSGAGDPGAHGRGALRVYWFLDGYYNGPVSCFRASPATAARANDSGANASSGNFNAPPQPTAEPRNPAEQMTPTPSGIAIGDAFAAGNFNVTVTGTDKSSTIGGTMGSASRAQGVYLVVYLTIESTSNQAVAFDYGSYLAQDATGNVYQFDAKATNALIQAGMPDGVNTLIDPGDTYNIAIVYDVPVDAAGFALTNGGATVVLDQ